MQIQKCVHHELHEVDIAVVVGVVHPEHVFLHLVSIISLGQSLKDWN